MAIKPNSQPQPKRVVLLSGSVRHVLLAQSKSGKSLARDYLSSLSEVDQRKFAARFQRLSEGLMLRNPEHIRALDKTTVEIVRDGVRNSVKIIIWEVKIDGHRLLAFQDEYDWVLTNGSPKIAKRAFSGAIETAKNVIADYLTR